MSADIVASIEAEGWAALPDLAERAETWANAALAGACVTTHPDAEISLLFTDDAQVRDLNRTWRTIDKPTNVLSFPAAPADRLADALALGDVVLAYETVAREAAADRKSLADHTAHLVVHGVLHLLGDDHEADADATVMESRETTILAGLGIADPYAENEPATPESSAA